MLLLRIVVDNEFIWRADTRDHHRLQSLTFGSDLYAPTECLISTYSVFRRY